VILSCWSSGGDGSDGDEHQTIRVAKEYLLSWADEPLQRFSSEMVSRSFRHSSTSSLKTGAQALGLVDGIAEAASNFFKIYSGSISDRYQKRKPLIVAGYALSVLTRPCYALFPTLAGALGLRFLDRLGKGTPGFIAPTRSSHYRPIGRSSAGPSDITGRWTRSARFSARSLPGFCSILSTPVQPRCSERPSSSAFQRSHPFLCLRGDGKIRGTPAQFLLRVLPALACAVQDLSACDFCLSAGSLPWWSCFSRPVH